MSFPKITGLRWWMIGLLMLGAIVNYLTRSTLAIAAVAILGELKITEKEYSWINNTFQVALMFQPLCGYLLDYLGLKLGMIIFVTAWSLTSMSHALAGSWQALAGLRALLGLAEGSANPAGMKMTAEWFPKKERGLAGGIYNIGASVGSMVAAPLVTWAILNHSWRFAFVITGSLGLVWLLIWLIFYRERTDHPALSSEEKAHIEGGQETHLQGDGKRPSILSLLRQRNFWGIALPRFFADPVWGVLFAWVPLYLMKERNFDYKKVGYTAWLPFLAADLGCLFGPVVVHWFQARGISLINARRGAFTVGAFMMIGIAFTAQVANPYVAIALLCLGGFAHQTLSVTVITMSSDLFKRSEVATVAGMAGLLGNLSIFIFFKLIGDYVAQVGYNPYFVTLGFLDLIGAVLLWTLVRDPQRTRPA